MSWRLGREQKEIDTKMLIPLTQGQFAIVDSDDFERLNEFRWFAFKSRQTFYAGRQVTNLDGKRRTLRMHRVITGAPAGLEVDHKNLNGLDNRKGNLRICSTENNLRNRRGTTKGASRFKGVSWSKECGKWRARIGFENKDYHGGVFSNEIDAARAYDELAKRLFGDFAFLNFK